MLDLIMEWALPEEGIRTVLLVGSRAANGKQDKLSDYDISVFGRYDEFATHDDWLKKIGPYLVCVHDQFDWEEILIPTRLVIFENGIKADFAFHPNPLLEQMIDKRQLSPTYDAGYKVILDKDGRADCLPKASLLGYTLKAPTQNEFSNAWNEFWFEAYHVAKYLHRNDLWIAGLRGEWMKKWLLKMLEWNASAKSGFSLCIQNDGKNLRNWIDAKYYARLDPCFSGWGQSTGIASLYACLDLFSGITKETALILRLAVDNKVEGGSKD